MLVLYERLLPTRLANCLAFAFSILLTPGLVNDAFASRGFLYQLSWSYTSVASLPVLLKPVTHQHQQGSTSRLTSHLQPDLSFTFTALTALERAKTLTCYSAGALALDVPLSPTVVVRRGWVVGVEICSFACGAGKEIMGHCTV